MNQYFCNDGSRLDGRYGRQEAAKRQRFVTAVTTARRDGSCHGFDDLAIKSNLTRMLAINVSVPNLTVVRMQQFRSQLRFERDDQQT